jgi:hypothetical protein
MREQVRLSKMEHCRPPMQTPGDNFHLPVQWVTQPIGPTGCKTSRAVPDRYIGLKSCD